VKIQNFHRKTNKKSENQFLSKPQNPSLFGCISVSAKNLPVRSTSVIHEEKLAVNK